MAVGPLTILSGHASDKWVRGWAWPEFDSKLLTLLAVTSIPAGINGAIGAGLSAALGRRQWLDITWLPAVIHTLLASVAMIQGMDQFLLSQLFALAFSVIVWPAGRLGQWIGSAFYSPKRNLQAAPVAITDPIRA
jgi:hypothetical protein